MGTVDTKKNTAVTVITTILTIAAFAALAFSTVLTISFNPDVIEGMQANNAEEVVGILGAALAGGIMLAVLKTICIAAIMISFLLSAIGIALSGVSKRSYSDGIRRFGSFLRGANVAILVCAVIVAAINAFQIFS